MNIEILLTEAEIANEFNEALEARDLPEKFFYWFPLSVKRWRALAGEPDYSELSNAWTAVSGRARELTADFGPDVPVISLGAGDGYKDRLLLRALTAAGKSPRYFPVDASQTLLEAACAGAEEDDIETVGIKADISSRMHVLLAADAAEAPRLFLMAGNTLGGFDPLEQVTNLVDAMRPGDRLVVDGELESPAAVTLIESNPSRDFTFAPLASLGLNPDDGRIRFEQKYDSRRSGLTLITRYFQADRDLRISLSGDESALARGERIFMNFHYLYNPAAFTWLLETHGGLRIEEQLFSSDGRFVTAICGK
jgi:uncharacterized SAM-dependent methyltransferase